MDFMRDLKECQAEVFRRSEQRIKARKKTHKRIVAVCIPLFLVVSLWSVLYKKTWGISPMQRLLSIRFEKCLEQLKTTSLPVSDILTENHFVNYHLFIKMCRERTGLSPTQYRKTQKQDLV